MIIGHQKIVEFLNKSIQNNRLAHAYLFVGSEHLGKKTVVLEFVKSLQCQLDIRQSQFGEQRLANGSAFPPAPQIAKLALAKLQKESFKFCGNCAACLEIDKNSYPDVLLVEPEMIEEKGKKREREMGIEKIRDIQHQVGLFSLYGKYKVIIIDRAEQLTRQASHALLKTLEEPSAKTIFILISSKPRSLLPTIISRCLLVKFLAVKNTEIEKQIKKVVSKCPSTAQLERIIRISSGRPGLVISYCQNPDLVEEQNKVIDELTDALRKDLNFRFKYAENLSKDTAAAQGVLNIWLMFFRDAILQKAGCDNLLIWANKKEKEKNILSNISITRLKDIIKMIIDTKQILSNSSFNARLALEVLMLNL